MAQAQTLVKESAPLKSKNGVLEQEYIARLEPGNNYYDPFRKYMYHLAARNQEREKPIVDARTNRFTPHQEFKPYQNLVLTSIIVWNNNRRSIRYYDGCTSIFVDEQPDDRETLEDFKKQTVSRAFLDGKFGEYGDNKLLLFYMDVCSWNGLSPFRTKTASQVFIPADGVQRSAAKASLIDQMEEALKYAREATDQKMRIHSNYLGLPTIDYDSGNELTEKELRIQYRQSAADNPKNFIETYGNKAIEVKFYIGKALDSGDISNSHNPNKATWGKNHTEICDISGLKSRDAIADRLYEFSQSEAGEEFLIQLKALYTN